MRWRSIQLRYRYPGAAGAISATWLTPLPVVAQPDFRPPADVYENDAALVVRAELGGLTEGAFDVQLYQDALVVDGHHRGLEDDDSLAADEDERVRGAEIDRELPPGE